MVAMRDQLNNRAEIQRKISLVLDRESTTSTLRGELTTGMYVFSMSKLYSQLDLAAKEYEEGRISMPKLSTQVDFIQPLSSYIPPSWVSMRSLVTGSVLKKRFLGNYASLFDHPSEEPVPSWKAIEWLLEDYGMSRVEDKA